jgi:hypothetical protein
VNGRVVFLLVLGLAQMTGDLLGLRPLQGLAAATAASPAPKVFSSVRGLETFSTRFFVEWDDTSGTPHSIQLTPEVYGRLGGTYNRRNTYGAAVAYAPVFAADERTQGMLVSVARYALCGEAPLVREFGVDPEQMAGPVRLRLVPRDGTEPAGLAMEFTAPCE